jgi:hypothetical protein
MRFFAFTLSSGCFEQGPAKIHQLLPEAPDRAQIPRGIISD